MSGECSTDRLKCGAEAPCGLKPASTVPHMAGQRGAALLVVLLFAAILAITLYEEMPSAVFEARRAKEQLLIDRGHEYVRAVQLYYRKFRPRYPPSMDALESTNNMRFLRHRFKDPFTGKDDWRLVHTNGIALTDSKVNPLKTAKKSNSDSSSNNGSSSGWFTNSTSAFGSSPSSTSTSSFSDTSSNDQPELIVPPVRKRGPEIPVNEGSKNSGNSLEAANQTGGDLNALLQAELANDGSASAPNPESNAQPSGANAAGSPGGKSPGSSTNPMQMVRNMLSNESPLAPQQTAPGMGAIQGSMIAGVASRAGGKSIKTINDQTDYSLWEFVYDPTKDRTGAPVFAAPAQAGQPSANTPFANTPPNQSFATTTSSTSGSATQIQGPQ